MADIKKFYPKNAAKNPDAVLEQAVGCYDSVVVMGWNMDGSLDLRASMNLTHAEVLWITSLVSHKLLSGDYEPLEDA